MAMWGYVGPCWAVLAFVGLYRILCGYVTLCRPV